MPYIPKEAIEEAKRIDLLTYLRKENPNDLVHIGGGQYMLRSHDSLKISNGLWHWFSRGIGGKTALSYLVEVEGLSFMDAALRLSRSFDGHAASMRQERELAEKEKREPRFLEKEIRLPKRHDDNNLVFRYLTKGRSIDPAVVRLFLQSGDVYESKHCDGRSGRVFTNAVFAGRDMEGAIRQAAIRGIDSGYKGEAAGSDKRYSFSISPKESDTVHVYEGAIDLMSYLTLLKKHGKQPCKDHHISLSGIFAPSRDGGGQRMPLALCQILKTRPEITKTVLHLDNDPPGRLSSASLIEVLGKVGISAIDSPPAAGKDVNDFLRRDMGSKRMECRTR